MPKTPYQKKLMDPRWQKMRLLILERDEFQCQHCCSKEKTLHVHHKYYTNCEPWDYPEDALITLCYECHYDEGELLTKVSKELIEAIKQSGAMANDFLTLKNGFENLDNKYFNNDLYQILDCFMRYEHLQRTVFDLINDL